MLFLLILMGATYLALTLLERLVPSLRLDGGLKGRITLLLVFLNTGLSHFYDTAGILGLVPTFLPLRTELVYLTGLLEILAAVALLVPRLQTFASLGLILFLVAVFPANIYGAFTYSGPGWHTLGPGYLLVRTPFQAFLIWWLYQVGLRTAPSPPVPTLPLAPGS